MAGSDHLGGFNNLLVEISFMPADPTTFTASEDKQTILSVLRERLPVKPSWSAARKILASRRISIGGVLCVDEGRRLAESETVEIHDQPLPHPPTDKDVKIRYVDDDLVIVEKPSGMVTLRRSSDLNWPWVRKNLQPTLDECVPRLIGGHAAQKKRAPSKGRHLPRMHSVHRIDRDSSGLLVFARNKQSQTRMIHQFAQHDAVRKYLALIPGTIEDQTVVSQFIRDRGDGLRGSTADTTIGQSATTHFRTQNSIGEFSELECRLETGRTNQIRIHLAELGHPICGDIKYRGPFGIPPVEDSSNIHRLALHAAELKFSHPTSNQPVHFTTTWPKDMQQFILRLRTSGLQG